MNALQKLAAKKKLTYMLKKAFVGAVASTTASKLPKPQPSPEVSGRSAASTYFAQGAKKNVVKQPKNPSLRTGMGLSNVPKY